MQRAIKNNNLGRVKRLTSAATFQDLDYAVQQSNWLAATLILDNDVIAEQLYYRCQAKLSFEEKSFLLRGENPRDFADEILKLKN